MTLAIPLGENTTSTHTKEEYAAIRQAFEDKQMAYIGQKLKSPKTRYTEARLEMTLSEWWDQIEKQAYSNPGDEGYDKDLKKAAQQEINKVQLRYINSLENGTASGNTIINIINYGDLDDAQLPKDIVEGEVITPNVDKPAV